MKGGGGYTHRQPANPTKTGDITMEVTLRCFCCGKAINGTYSENVSVIIQHANRMRRII
jgi:hypothetical protein